MKPLEYLHLQLRLEGKSVLHDGTVVQVEAVPGEEAPLVMIAHLADGEQVMYYGESIPSSLRAELAACTPSVVSILTALQAGGMSATACHYKTYVCPMDFPNVREVGVQRFSKDDPKVIAFGFDGFDNHVFAVERAGRLVSACVSARENGQCGEAWVYTDPEFSNQGLAQAAVSIWAKSLAEAGKVAFYSHKMDNFASARLANRLELKFAFEEINFSQPALEPDRDSLSRLQDGIR